MSRARRLPALAALVAALFAAVGCGDDGEVDSEVTTPAETPTAAEPTETGPLEFEDVQLRLEEAGFTVEEEEPEGLIRREDGGIVVADEKIVVSGGELAGGSDVSVYGLGSEKDVEAMEEFAGGDVSLVQGSVFFQSSEPGEAATVAAAAQP